MRMLQEEEERLFSSILAISEDNQHLGGEDCNIPKLAHN